MGDHVESGKRSRSRKARKQRKEEKEEEVRRGPRDTKVVLVDERLFRSLQGEAEQPLQRPHEKRSSTSFDFPALCKSPTERPPPPLTCKWGAPEESRAENKMDKGTDATSWTGRVAVVPRGSAVSVSNNVVKNEAESSAGMENKKKKSKGPVVVDLETVLQVRSHLKQRKPSNLSFKAKKPPTERLVGNILDSSNPIRCKGKFRENKRKRLSNLKTNIIKDRIMKSLGEDIESAASTVDFKKEIERYLGNLRKERESKKEQKFKGTVSAEDKTKTIVVSTKDGAALEPPVEKAQHTSFEARTQFSSKFRWYCENMLTPNLDAAVKELISGVVQLQDRAFARDPQRARMRKRHVTGIREAGKYLRLKKIKVIIIAPDLEASEPEGSIGQVVLSLKQEAALQSVPCIFALNRRKIGYSSLKKAPVSVFAILSLDGLEDQYKIVIGHFEDAKNIFKSVFGNVENGKAKEEAVFSNLLQSLTLSAEDGE